MSALALKLGEFALVGGSGQGWDVEVLGDDADWGNPVPRDVALVSLLQDGAPTVTQGYDNREIRFRIEIKGVDSGRLAQAEAALFAEVGDRNQLVFTPWDGWGAPTVFEVWTSHFDYQPNDLQEVLQGTRTYLLVLVCEPFGHSVDEVVTEAVPAEVTPGTPPVEVSIDACSSATGWTASPAPVLGAGSGELYAERPLGQAGGAGPVSLTRTSAAIDMSATPYLIVDWWKTGGFFATGTTVRAFADGAELALRAIGSSPTAGYNRSIYYCPDTSVTVFKVSAMIKVATPGTVSLRVAQLSRTDGLPSVGTTRQKYRTVAVGGAARTQGSLEVSHATSALGDVLVYTSADDGAGHVPALRTWRVSGGTVTTDTAMVSGARDLLDTALVYEVPIGQVPSGQTLLMARLRSNVASAQRVNWSAQTVLGGIAVGPMVSGTRLVNFAATATDYIVPLGSGQFRAQSVDPTSAAKVRVTIVADAPAASNIELDEAWRFNTDIGALTQVACGTGTIAVGGPANYLSVAEPTTDTPQPKVMVGVAADPTSWIHAAQDNIGSWMRHEFVPPRVNVFTVTTAALDAAVRLRHLKRWPTHAVD